MTDLLCCVHIWLRHVTDLSFYVRACVCVCVCVCADKGAGSGNWQTSKYWEAADKCDGAERLLHTAGDGEKWTWDGNWQTEGVHVVCWWNCENKTGRDRNDIGWTAAGVNSTLNYLQTSISQSVRNFLNGPGNMITSRSAKIKEVHTRTRTT